MRWCIGQGVRRWFAAAGILLLTGCVGQQAPQAEPAGRTEGLYYEASGISPDAVLLTVDGRDVPAWRYFYWLTWGCDQLRTAYLDAGLALNWAETVEGVPLSDYVRQQALENTVLYAVVENWAEAYGVTISETDQTELDELWKSQAKEVGGEDNYLALMAQRGLDRTEAEVLCQDALRYRKLYRLFETPGSALSPDSGAVAAFAAERGYRTVDWLIVPVEDGTDRESARQQAASLFAQLNGSDDPFAAFDALSDTYGGDSGAGKTFLPDADILPQTVTAAAQTLEEGQWSGILEAENGFYILLRRPLDEEAVCPDYFDDLLAQAAQGAEVVTASAYDTLEAPAFYERLTAARTGSEHPNDDSAENPTEDSSSSTN